MLDYQTLTKIKTGSKSEDSIVSVPDQRLPKYEDG